MHFLLNSMSNIYFVCYNQNSTLDPLRLALLQNKFVDFKLHILPQNNALKAGGTIRNRSQSRLAPLKRLW